MPQTLGEIFNMALGACGSNLLVSDSEELSREAAICRLWYPLVRDNVQTSAPWASVKSHQRLARLSDADLNLPWEDLGAEPGYAYAYAVPSGLLIPRFMSNYQPFSYGSFGDRRVISTSDATPILTYNRRNEDTAEWDVPLTMTIVYTLAVHIARQVSGRASTIAENIGMADRIVSDMRMQEANVTDEPIESVPDYISARGYAVGLTSRFFYPLNNISYGLIQ